jgi:hypothetical protein
MGRSLARLIGHGKRLVPEICLVTAIPERSERFD